MVTSATSPAVASKSPRSGFTIIELLVVVGILLLLAGLVIVVFNADGGSDKVRSAARVSQSAFLGARDRALFAKDRRGLRLVRDTVNTDLVTAFVFIQPSQVNLTYDAPSTPVRILRPDTDNNMIADSPDATLVEVTHNATSKRWTDLYSEGLFSTPPRIKIPATTLGKWYQFAPSGTNPQVSGSVETLTLFSGVIETGSAFPTVEYIASTSCEFELANELLPLHAPIDFTAGIVIDLANSSANVSATWAGNTNNADILFTTRGTIGGYLSANGPLHFLLRDIRDATEGRSPAYVGTDITQRPQYEQILLTVFPMTGNVQSFPTDPTDANADDLADDLFHFAKIGSVAGQ